MTVQPPPKGTEATGSSLQAAGEALIGKILDLGIDGAGPWQGARAMPLPEGLGPAEREALIKRTIAHHRRLVGVGGFVTGFGGLATMTITVPADVLSFYAASTRMTAAIGVARGYDLSSEEFRTIVALSQLGAAGTTALAEAGIRIGTRSAVAALHRLPASTLLRINQRVGFKLVTRLGEKGAINLAKVVPVLGGGIGAGINVAGLNVIARYAKQNFPPLEPPTIIGEV